MARSARKISDGRSPPARPSPPLRQQRFFVPRWPLPASRARAQHATAPCAAATRDGQAGEQGMSTATIETTRRHVAPSAPAIAPGIAPTAPREATGGVGLVRRQLAHFDFTAAAAGEPGGPFALELGGALDRLTFAYETYGTLNAARDNA